MQGLAHCGTPSNRKRQQETRKYQQICYLHLSFPHISWQTKEMQRLIDIVAASARFTNADLTLRAKLLALIRGEPHTSCTKCADRVSVHFAPSIHVRIKHLYKNILPGE